MPTPHGVAAELLAAAAEKVFTGRQRCREPKPKTTPQSASAVNRRPNEEADKELLPIIAPKITLAAARE